MEEKVKIDQKLHEIRRIEAILGYFTGSQEIFLQNLYFGGVVINGSPYEKIKNFANYPP